MNCIKCGRELRDEQVFCFECQEVMESYPVKPGTPVLLPVRPQFSDAKPKASRSRNSLPPEIRLRRMRTTVRLLILALVASLLAFVLTSFLALRLLDERDTQSRIGQNYRVAAQE